MQPSEHARGLRPLASAALLLALAAMLPLASCAGRKQAHEVTEDAAPTGVLADLVGADSARVYALHPYPHAVEADPGPRFHDYLVLGEAELADVADGDYLLALLELGIEGSDGRVAGCFNPRHGLRVEKDGRTTDFVICFECFSMEVHEDGAATGGHETSSEPERVVTAFYEARGLTIHTDG